VWRRNRDGARWRAIARSNASSALGSAGRRWSGTGLIGLSAAAPQLFRPTLSKFMVLSQGLSDRCRGGRKIVAVPCIHS
jgi:hypothetical protein